MLEFSGFLTVSCIIHAVLSGWLVVRSVATTGKWMQLKEVWFARSGNLIFITGTFVLLSPFSTNIINFKFSWQSSRCLQWIPQQFSHWTSHFLFLSDVFHLRSGMNAAATSLKEPSTHCYELNAWCVCRAAVRAEYRRGSDDLWGFCCLSERSKGKLLLRGRERSCWPASAVCSQLETTLTSSPAFTSQLQGKNICQLHKINIHSQY